jgi:hypothetical protein
MQNVAQLLVTAISYQMNGKWSSEAVVTSGSDKGAIQVELTKVQEDFSL